MRVTNQTRCGNSQCGTAFVVDETERGFKIYVSYGTIVGLEAFGRAIFTDKRHSVTTSKQCTTKLYRNAGYARVHIIAHDDFLTLCRIAGLTIATRQCYGQQSQDATSPIDFTR